MINQLNPFFRYITEKLFNFYSFYLNLNENNIKLTVL